MSYTKAPLTYEREYSGENWHIATVAFGLSHEQVFTIVTDHVHGSDIVQGDPEDDVRLWCAARDLLHACKAVENQMKNGYINPDQCLDWLAAAIAKATQPDVQSTPESETDQ